MSLFIGKKNGVGELFWGIGENFYNSRLEFSIPDGPSLDQLNFLSTVNVPPDDLYYMTDIYGPLDITYVTDITPSMIKRMLSLPILIVSPYEYLIITANLSEIRILWWEYRPGKSPPVISQQHHLECSKFRISRGLIRRINTINFLL